MLVTEDDFKSISKTMEILVVEFVWQAFEEYISSGFETPATSRPPKMAGMEGRAHAQLSPTKVGKIKAVG